MPKRTTVPGSLRNVRSSDGKAVIGFAFNVRLPRYRGNMVSLINGYYVNVDGREYPQTDIRFLLNGKGPRTFEELKSAVWEHWNYQDEATLLVLQEGGLAPGSHVVIATVSNFEQYGYMPGRDERRVAEGEAVTSAGSGFGGPALPQTLILE